MDERSDSGSSAGRGQQRPATGSFPESDTIAAVATAPGEGAIGIVRVSGPAAPAIADRIFRGRGGRALSQTPSFRLVLGTVVESGSDEEIDEVLAVRMPEGRSYTRECLVEFQSHGGRAVLDAILASVIRCGARCAEPGEFTRRAFLNGRIDLAQAEAVADLIRAESDAERRSAFRRLQGATGREVRSLKELLLELVAEAEAILDFGEEEGIGESFSRGSLERVAESARDLAERSRARRAGEGARAAIVGRPNSGKSSLFNVLVDSGRSIVTAIPGTTRDYIEERAVLAGVSLVLIDTAGIRPPLDAAEEEGVRRSWELISEAGILVLLIDGSEPLDDKDVVLAQALADQSPLIAISKSDLPAKIDIAALGAALGTASIFRLSSKTGEGCTALAKALAARHRSLTEASPPSDVTLNYRHREALDRAVGHLRLACEHACGARPLFDKTILDLRGALASLEEITGETSTEAILDRVFSRFCLGK